MLEKLNDLKLKANDQNLNNTKRVATLLEKESFQFPKISKSTEDKVHNVLKKDQSVDGQVQCLICKDKGVTKYLRNDWGLTIHISKSHNTKNKK